MNQGNGMGEPGDPVPDDYEEARPGLARERTDLAWTRSAIAFLALGAAILKIRPAIGFPVMGVGVVIWLLGHISPRRDRIGLVSRRTLVVTVAVTGLAVVSVVLTLAGPPSRGLRP